MASLSSSVYKSVLFSTKSDHLPISTNPRSGSYSELDFYPKLRTRFSLSGKNLGFLANTFSTSQILDKGQKVKLLSHIGLSLSVRATTPQEYPVAKKWIKSS